MQRPMTRGLLGCPNCLRAAVAFIAVILVLGGLALVWWTGRAMAAQGVELQLCGVSTCKPLDSKQQEQLAHGGTLILQSDVVKSVGAIPNCDACAVIGADKGVRFYVMGSPRDVACKVFGGPSCTAK